MKKRLSRLSKKKGEKHVEKKFIEVTYKAGSWNGMLIAKLIRQMENDFNIQQVQWREEIELQDGQVTVRGYYYDNTEKERKKTEKTI